VKRSRRHISYPSTGDGGDVSGGVVVSTIVALHQEQRKVESQPVRFFRKVKSERASLLPPFTTLSLDVHMHPIEEQSERCFVDKVFIANNDNGRVACHEVLCCCCFKG